MDHFYRLSVDVDDSFKFWEYMVKIRFELDFYPALIRNEGIPFFGQLFELIGLIIFVDEIFWLNDKKTSDGAGIDDIVILCATQRYESKLVCHAKIDEKALKMMSS